MRYSRAVFVISAVLLLAAAAPAQTAEEILAVVEKKTSGDEAPRDMESTLRMTLVGTRGDSKVRELRAWSKNNESGDDWRIMKFLSPADMRDIGLLVLAEDRMYLYLPEFRRVRRIASHNKKDNFMGSDFSYDDLGTSVYSAHYTPRLAGEEDGAWILELERKPESDKPYKTVRLRVLKDSGLPDRMEMADDSGAPWKVAEQEIGKTGAYRIPVKIVMRDLKAKSHTVLEMTDIRVDQNLDEEIFSERFLKRSVR
jgi:outer membrane lipoprotein-sorting protein